MVIGHEWAAGIPCVRDRTRANTVDFSLPCQRLDQREKRERAGVNGHRKPEPPECGISSTETHDALKENERGRELYRGSQRAIRLLTDCEIRRSDRRIIVTTYGLWCGNRDQLVENGKTPRVEPLINNCGQWHCLHPGQERKSSDRHTGSIQESGRLV